MKKLFVLFIVLITGFVAVSQQINKNYVTFEIVTGTWCYYCPAAANGAEDMANNGHDVAIIEYHGGDDYQTVSSGARINYYGVTSYPTAILNGTTTSGTGGHTGSMYSQYLATYNQLVDDLTSFSCDLEVISTNDIDFTATISMEKVADYSGNNLKLLVAVTESDIEESWQGLTHLHFVERAMYPSASGTVLDFNSNSEITEEIEFVVDPSWDLSNCELVVFIQDMTTDEILQVDKASLDIPAGTNNVLMQGVLAPFEDEFVCETDISPTILFKNKGTADLTSVDFLVYINDELLDTYNWTGSLISGETLELDLNEVTYNQNDENEMVVIAENPNGVTDDFPDNNTASQFFSKSDETTTRVFLEMNTGNWGFEITYSLFNSIGTEIYTSGSIDGEVLDTFTVSMDECHYFELYDSYGNGFNSDNGFCTLIDSDGNELFNISGDFGYETYYPFKPTTIANIIDISSNELSIYPNPVKNFLNIEFNEVNNYDITVFDVNGKIVINSNLINSNLATINVNDLNAGIYFVLIKSDKLNISQKIIVE